MCSVYNWPFIGHSPPPICMYSITNIIQRLNDDVQHKIIFYLEDISGFSNPTKSPLAKYYLK